MKWARPHPSARSPSCILNADPQVLKDFLDELREDIPDPDTNEAVWKNTFLEAWPPPDSN
jgi:hypothetical protein